MTEYKLQRRVFSTDYLTASRATGGNPGVAIWAHDIEGEQVAVFAGPIAAREFARGILALCDEIDGGEAQETVPALPSVKVGDRFRVTRGRLASADVVAGEIVTVVSLNAGGTPDFRATGARTARSWRFGPEDIGDGLEPVESRDDAVRGIKVGDRVVVVRPYAHGGGPDGGEEGIVTGLDPRDAAYPYQVRLDGAYYPSWVHEVRKVDEPAEPAAPTVLLDEAREALLRRAATFVRAIGARPDDPDAVLRVARWLGGE